MGEILAFVFTGSAAPTQEDFYRSAQMLVSRDKHTGQSKLLT
jgi:hypothetical protein